MSIAAWRLINYKIFIYSSDTIRFLSTALLTCSGSFIDKFSKSKVDVGVRYGLKYTEARDLLAAPNIAAIKYISRNYIHYHDSKIVVSLN